MRLRLTTPLLSWTWIPLFGILISACGDSKSKDSTASSSTKGMAFEPKTISDVIAAVNAMPKPLTLPAFLAALPHPLFLDATNSTSSLQPAKGVENPRIFIVSRADSKTPLFMTIQLEGEQSHALELGEITATSHQLGNIEFPVTKTLAVSDVLRTTCGTGGCHMSGEYVQPSPALRVSFNTISQINSECKASSTRCDVLHALFKKPTPRSYSFPANFH